MKVLTLSWEYPPKIVGGIARVVYDLTKETSAKGVNNYIITCGEEGLKEYEQDGNSHIYRVRPYAIECYNFIQWVYHLNMAMVERAVMLNMEQGPFDVIHVHDWITAFCGRALKKIFNKPMVATVHATEFGRNNGLHNDMQRYISNIEWWLTYEACKVIVNSRFMENQLTGFFQLPKDKITVIPNGVRVDAFQCITPPSNFRTQYASEHEKIIFYVGRIVQEKGVHLIIESIPALSKEFEHFKVVIAGKGPNLELLKKKAAELHVGDRVYFTGFVDDHTRNMLYSIADVAVFPSLYEPFGIVALEGMAAKVPTIVSDTGGLRETVDHEIDGLKFHCGISGDLAHKIAWILKNPQKANDMAHKAYDKVSSIYNWNYISDMVMGIYSEIL